MSIRLSVSMGIFSVLCSMAVLTAAPNAQQTKKSKQFTPNQMHKSKQFTPNQMHKSKFGSPDKSRDCHPGTSPDSKKGRGGNGHCPPGGNGGGGNGHCPPGGNGGGGGGNGGGGGGNNGGGGGGNPGPVAGIPGPNGLGHYGPFATIRRALEVVQLFQSMGYPNTIQFHNGDGQYVLPRR